MKVKSITIEGLHNVVEKQYDFNQLNYLHGANGAGKSTVLQAVQLAILGYIPGYSKKNEDIIRHARKNTISIICKLDHEGQEVTITRSWINTGKSTTKSVSVDPEVINLDTILAELELPIFNFNEFCNMTSNKLKEWFISFLPNVDGEIDWEKELTEALGEFKVIDDKLLPDVLTDISTVPGTGVDKIKAVNLKLKDRLSYSKAELTRLQNTTNSLVYYEEYEGSTDIEAMKAQVDALRNNMLEQSRIDAIKASNAKICAELDTIVVDGVDVNSDDRIKHLNSELTNLSEMADKFSQEIKKIDSRAGELNFLIKNNNAILSGKGICPYTKAECESIKELMSKLEREIEEARSELLTLDTTRKNTAAALQSAQLTARQYSNELNEIRSKYLRKSRLESQLEMEPLIEGTEMSQEDIMKQIDAIQDNIIKATANKQYSELIDKLTADKYAMENSIEVLKKWIKLTDANGMQTAIMDKPFELLASDMDKYIQQLFMKDNITTHFHLSEKANSFSFGLKRDDKYIAFDMLSAGERCIYTLALMMCIVSKSESPLKLILLDDLLDHLDDENIVTLFEALHNSADIQFIIAGVKPCNNTFSKDVVIEIN